MKKKQNVKSPHCNIIFVLFTKDVDIELRIVCEQFIQNVSESLISPLSAFLTKVNVVLLFIHATTGDSAQDNRDLKQVTMTTAMRMSLNKRLNE